MPRRSHFSNTLYRRKGIGEFSNHILISAVQQLLNVAIAPEIKMNNQIKLMVVFFCVVSFLKTGNASDVFIKSKDITMAAAGSGNSLNPGFADSALKGMVNLKSGGELNKMTYGNKEGFTVVELPRSAAVLLTGLLLIVISLVGKKNYFKK